MAAMNGRDLLNSNGRRMGSRTRGISLLLATLLSCFVPASDTLEQELARKVESSIAKLYSTSDEERRLAIEQLIQIGSPSVKPLLKLIQELVLNPAPRFPTRREREGVELVGKYKSQVENGHPDVTALSFLDIGWRLKRDIYEVLGRLKAPESIPTLLEIMEWREAHDGDEPLTGEMVALAQIGAPAVAPLVEVIQKAETIAGESLKRPCSANR